MFCIILDRCLESFGCISMTHQHTHIYIANLNYFDAFVQFVHNISGEVLIFERFAQRLECFSSCLLFEKLLLGWDVLTLRF